jgi:hypothetical protein
MPGRNAEGKEEETNHPQISQKDADWKKKKKQKTWERQSPSGSPRQHAYGKMRKAVPLSS